MLILNRVHMPELLENKAIKHQNYKTAKKKKEKRKICHANFSHPNNLGI